VNPFEFILVSGFVFGVIHSFDPDHLAAMSTLLGREREPLGRAFTKGLTWGLGHTLSLVLLGVLLVAFDAQVSGLWERAFEASVGVVLVYLGLRRLHDARRRPHLHVHRHGDLEHMHYHVHGRRVDHGAEEAHKTHSHAPLWIGILHGFAGTAAVMALLPAVIIDQVDRYLIYVLTFGLGSTLAMATFCTGIGHLTVRLQHVRGSGHRWWAASAGSLSLALGIVWLGSTLLA
jgi:ABC-type nickel/cobalt efflux system permease component RcnA